MQGNRDSDGSRGIWANKKNPYGIWQKRWFVYTEHEIRYSKAEDGGLSLRKAYSFRDIEDFEFIRSRSENMR
jgi:hypothetical protein